MKKLFFMGCFLATLIVLSANGTPIVTIKTDTSFNVTSERTHIATVALDVYSKKTGEYIRTDKNVSVWRNSNGGYEIKFIYGWFPVKRSYKRGYSHYCEDSVNIYFFNL